MLSMRNKLIAYLRVGDHEQKKASRSWLIETMKVMDMILTNDFSLSDVYKYESHFKTIFPNNNFLKEKIRQQLQFLRDKGIIEFKGKGQYKKTN